ncbi:hypothetical protein AARAC_004550 [Aspergillus arachidicola]|uniref:Uncharacterized protein n=1 Tax=Aspergillus arachidicola TaxID=656916 RepID=A0A2G7G583_9EURO|nr:hypothetical protein AARAC_004550 [Aspergillus arachidicola]
MVCQPDECSGNTGSGELGLLGKAQLRGFTLLNIAVVHIVEVESHMNNLRGSLAVIDIALLAYIKDTEPDPRGLLRLPLIKFVALLPHVLRNFSDGVKTACVCV